MDKYTKAETNGLSIAALVFGILGVLTSWALVFNLPNALLTFMFALLSRGRRKCGDMAKVSIILGIITLAIGVIVVLSVADVAVRYFRQFPVDTEMIQRELQNLLEQLRQGGMSI